MSRAWIAFACAAALVLAAGCGGSTDTQARPAAPSTATDPFVGVAANTLGWGADVGRAQDIVRHSGVRLLREELSWDIVEPTRGARRWATTDRLMVAAAHRHLQMLVLLTGIPKWAARPNGGLPTRTAAYGAYVRDVVARYGPNGGFWRRHPTLPRASAPTWFELWNEPYYAPPLRSTLDTDRYAALARAGLNAGRAADPDARFLVEVDASYAGEEQVSDDWLDGVERAAPGLLADADAVAVHPYSDREPVSEGEVTHLRSALTQRGLKTPIWITEVGWSTCTERGSGCVGETEQASALRRFLTAMARRPRDDVAKVFVYNMHDLGRVPTEREQHFGVLRLDGSHKPSWSVLRRFATTAHENVRGAPSAHATAGPGR
jgi:hypothetical protein